MEPGAVVVPPFAARPLRLAPFRALRLPPRRVGDPGTLRQLSRPPRVGLVSWRERTHVVQDAVPAVYLHEYAAGGLIVRGLVGALDVSRRARSPQQRAILPHEGIKPVQADDLADRMLELGLNPAPILLVHRAEPAARELVHRTMARPADHDFVDRAGQRHRVWAIHRPDQLRQLDAALAESQALIADGHHRYAAYLRLQGRHPGGSMDLGLAMLVDQTDTPLFLGPIHRCLIGVSLDDVAVAVEATGHRLERTSKQQALSRLGPWGVAVTDGTDWASLSLQPGPSGDRAAVEVLHDDLLPALPRGPQSIDYLHSVEQTLRSVRRSRRVALLMPAPEVDQVLRIAAAGRLLPAKATSFQPKPSVGVLIRSLTDN
ncbi:MAG: DUF1015 domain-containing protein [Nocardioides sp.]|nr:DUF1015 domain-containing protein [Nocardioides sp.]